MITILYGTETGNAEMVADDIADALTAAGLENSIVAMEDAGVDDLVDAEVAVVVTSTYGEGELPATTAPFHDALVAAAPDLSGVRFAGFGLGDSSYATYNNAIQTFTATLESLGARPVCAIGRHDATSGESSTDAATTWVEDVLLTELATPAASGGCPFGHTL